LDRHVLALDKSLFLQTLLECRHEMHEPCRRRAAKKANHRHRRLLRARRERPCRHAAEKRDELAPVHSITSSARASTVCGTSKPRTFAVIKFTARSILVGCSTGSSLGFAPRRILST